MIYFIRATGSGAVKIGFTNHPAKARMAQLQTSSPDDLELLGTCYGGSSTERVIHGQFAEYRIRGEWFKGTEDLLDKVRLYIHLPFNECVTVLGMRVWQMEGVVRSASGLADARVLAMNFSGTPPLPDSLLWSDCSLHPSARSWDSVRVIRDVTREHHDWGELVWPGRVCQDAERIREPMVYEVAEKGGIAKAYKLRTKGYRYKEWAFQDMYCPYCGCEEIWPITGSDSVRNIPFYGQCGHLFDVRFQLLEGRSVLVYAPAKNRAD